MVITSKLWLLVTILLHVGQIAMSSHFRGGIVQWRPVNPTNFDGRIEVTHRMGWRRSWNSQTNCNTADVGTTRLFGFGSLQCTSGCSGSFDLQFFCTDFSIGEDWVVGERTVTYNVGTSTSSFEAVYDSCCWISGSGVSGAWQIRVRGSLARRSDNRRINSSPVTTTTPIVRLQGGCMHSIRIPVQDADQDVVRCRWATGNECGGACNRLPGAIMDENNCIITWTPPTTNYGLYAVAVQIEDFISSSSTLAMSSVPLQFLIDVFSSSQSCTAAAAVSPSLVPGETPPDGSCIPVPFGTTYRASIVAYSGSSTSRITGFTTASPFGLVTTSVIQSPHNSSLYFTNVTWTPTTSQYGLHQFCFRAVNNDRLESNQSCITLLGGVTGPSALSNSLSPVGRFTPTSSTTWSITFDQAISRPSSSRYIRFYEVTSGRNVYNFNVATSAATFPAAGSGGRMLTFRFSYSFTAGLAYYILLDSGIAVGAEFCNQESIAVTNTAFWSFTTGCAVGYVQTGSACVDVNECAAGTYTCPTNAGCVNTIGSYTCQCLSGYEASGNTCVDINECTRGTHQCHAAATCTNTDGSYNCTCPIGSSGDGRICTDLCDECLGMPSGCGLHNCNANTSDCTNTIGGFQCTCRFGLAADGVSCVPPPRPDPPTSVQVSTTGTTTITITWAAPPVSIGNAISVYVLVLTESVGNVTITQSVTGTTYTFTGLQEYRTYTCVITAVSIYGPISVATAPLTITTQEAAPSAPPQNFVAQPNSSRSAVISWNPPPSDDINGVIIRYVINVTVVGTNTTFQLTSLTNTLTVNNLSPFTTFVCIIAAVTSVGIGPFSTQFTLITPQDAPTIPPQNVVLSPVSSTSIGLTWSPPPATDINGVITEYRINITEVTTGRVITLTSTTTSIVAQGLHPFYAYECIVSAYTVDIGPYTQIFRITTPEDVPSGSPLSFGGTATTSRSATISWNPPRTDLQNGIIISYVINVTVLETGVTFQLTSNTTSLTVSSLSPYRNFICIIAAVTSVGIGPFSSQFTLTTPQDIPTRAPQLPTAIARNSRAIYCSWNPPPVDHQNGQIIEYRINITEVNTGTVFMRVSTSTSIVISSLHPDYVYEWIVTAVTIGEGPYTVTSTIRTPEDAPSGPPQSPSAAALTARSIQLNWQPPLLEDQNGVITGYIITVTSLNSTISTQHTTNSTTFTVPSLNPFTNYVCVVAATTAVGQGPFSSTFQVQTLESAPGSHPSNFTGMSVNSTSIYLTWDPPPPSQVNGVIREYRLSITEAATGQVFQYTTPPDELELTVEGLHPYYIYHCSVVAYTILPGPYTAVFTIQTEEDVPTGPPTNFSTSVVDAYTISLSWDPPQADQQNGILRYYVVTLTSNLPTVTRNISASQQTISVGNLRPNTLYSCKVEVGTIGLGPPTLFQYIWTPEDAPNGPPQNANLTINDSRSLILTWEVPLPQEVNGIVVDYTINITSSLGINSIVVGSNTTSYTVTNLTPYIAYTCIVAAHTSVGRGPFSVGVTLTTPEDAPEAPPSSTSHSNIMSRTVDLSWSPPRSDRHNGVIRYYVIEAYENATGMVLTYQTLSDQTRFTLTNLHPYYTYSIRVAAFTVSTGPFSSSITILTMQDVPTAPPVSPYGYPVADTSTLIFISWSPVPAEHLNGILLFYLVDVTEVITNNSWTFHAVQTHIIVGPLHPFYTYRCRVAAFTTALGPFTPEFYVNSGETFPSAPPANLTASRTTTTSLTLTWDPPRYDLQNGMIRHFIIYITDVTNGTSWQITTNTTRYTILNLKPFYTYNCSVSAVTIGEGPISNSIVVTLPQSAPTVAPTNIRGFAIDHSRISLEWDSVPLTLEILNGVLSGYIVNVTERETGYIFEVNTTTTSIVLESLHPDYVYECRVAAYTVVPGPFSTVFAVQVLMSAPSGPPENITTIALSSSAIQISWDPPREEHRNGPILAYNFTAMDTVTGSVITSSVLVPATTIVSNLSPFTSYTFTLSARTSIGFGPEDSVTELTLQALPSEPTGVNVSRIDGDPNSLLVTWNPPAVPNGYITYYNVYCEENVDTLSSGQGLSNAITGNESSITFSNTVSVSELNTTITGLTPFTTYSCYVSANTSVGEGNTTASMFEVTDEFIPADPPTNIQVSVVNATAVFLSWYLPDTPYGVVVSYTILVEDDSNNVTTIVVSASTSMQGGTTAIVEELLPFTNYNFSIAASTRIGTGPYDTVSAMTPQFSPYGTPLNIMVTVSGTTTANASWSPPDPDMLNGVLTYYTVLLRDVMFGMPDRVYNTTLTSFSFNGLEEYATYDCNVAAATVVGLGPFLSARFTTLEAIPTAPPQNISGLALSSTLIMLFWSPPPPLDVNGVVRYYTVEAVERHTGRQWTFFAVDPDLHVGSLHPYYYYDFNVSATTVGMGPFSSQFSVLTLPESPTAAPEQLSLNTKTSTSLTFTWNPPPFEDTNGPIQYYMVQLTELETNTTLPSRTTFNRQITYSGLHPYYTYQCTVAAYTVGLGPYTPPITVQLDQEAPTAPPLNLAGTSVSSSSIFVSWDLPLFSERNGMIQHYLVNVTETDTGLKFGHVALGTNITLFSLHPFYTYSITVTAVTTAPGPPTTAFLVRTDEDIPSGPAQDLNASVISYDEVYLTWEDPDVADQNGVIVSYEIDLTIVTTGQSFQMTSSTTNILLTNLVPFTTYTCRVAATTSVGSGPYSIAISFLTDETAPSGVPENVSVSAISSTSIQVSWSPPPPTSRNGIITEYRINVTELNTGTQQLLTSFTTSLVVQSLHPYYMYEFTVSAHTVATGPFSQSQVIQTPEDVPSGFPQMFRESIESSRSVTFSWDAPRVEEQNGVIVSYTLNIAETGSGMTIQRIVPSNQTTITVTALLPFTSYDCLIAASTSIGLGPFSTILSITTPEDSPALSPTNLTGSALDSTTIQLEWAPPNSPHHGIIREYRINITEFETGNVIQRVSFTTNLVVGNLHPDYTYDWIVTAFTVAEGPYSSSSSITTPEDVPSGPPTSIVSTALTSGSIYLSWDLPLMEERNGEITGYVINITDLDSGRVVQYTRGTVSNTTIENLSPFTVYVANIAARTAVGVGPFSSVVSTQTLEDVPGNHPLNSTGYALNSTHIFLDWSPPSQEDLNGVIREYRINFTEVETNMLRQLTTDPSTTELIVGPLHPFYIYHATILAFTVGEGPNTTVISIRTEQDVPSGPPTGVSVSATSSRSISLSWAPPQRDQQNGIILYYLVTVISSSGSITRNVSSVQQTISIAGLNPYTDYNCTVQAETIGVGPPSPVVQISTPEDVPTGPPTNVNAQAMSPTSFTLFWDQPSAEHRNGLILGYSIQVTELETGYMERFNTTEETFVINERHPFYRYRYVVAAETIGLGPYSVASLIHMPEAAPSGSPVNVTITAVSSTGFLLSWDDPLMADRNGIVRNYIINVTEENTGNQIQLTSNTNNQRVESLHPFYNYSCVVSAVTVEAGPFSESIETTTSEDVPSGPPTNFFAMALSSTSVELTWNSPQIHERNGVITLYTITQVIAGNFSTYTTSDLMLEVVDLRPFSTYIFTITASTSIGEGPPTAGITAVTLEDAPEGAPANVATSNITSTSLTLTWLPPTNTLQNGVIRHYIILGLEVDTGTNFTYQAQSHTSFSIGDLHPYYTYQFNVFAVTVEVGPASLDHTVTTLEDVPTAPPGTINASPVDSSTLLINWTPLPLESRNGLITEYVVNISAMETGDRFQHTAVGSDSSLPISMLHPDYTYTYTVAARTAIGQGPFSNSSSIRMPEDIPTLAPQNTTGRAVNSTSIFFTWEHPLPSGRNGNITGYSLIVRELVTNTTTAYRQTGDHIDLVVGSLHPYYQYECVIAAETRVGRGPYGNPFIVRTLADVPSGVPLNVTGMAVTTRSIQLMWNPPETDEQNGVIQHYLVIVRVTQTHSSFSINSSTTSVTIPNLHPAYEYSIEVAAVTINVGPFSSALSITTPDDVPTGTPVAVEAVSISSTSIRISWQAPLLELQNGEITSYFITILELETNTLINITTVATDSIYVINSLHPFYHYNCSVAAYTNGLGPSAFYVVQTQPEEPSVSPSNVTVIATNASTVLVSWIPPPPEDRNGIIQGYTVRVEGVHTDDDFTLSTNFTEVIVGSLHPFYAYRFTVATVTISHGPFSNPISLTMPPLAPSQPVSNITVEATSPTSLRLCWLPPSHDEWNGIIIRYTIEYNLLRQVLFDGDDDDDDDDEMEVGLPSEPLMRYIVYAPTNLEPLRNLPDPRAITDPLVWEEREINGLEEYYLYSISVYYENSAGRSASSDSVLLNMPSAAPSGPPIGVTATVTDSAINVRWSPPEQLEQNGPIISYETTLTYQNGTKMMYPSTRNTFSIQIEGLPKFAIINVTVAARTDVGTGPPSPPVVVMTFDGLPGAPSGVDSKILDKNSVSLTWSLPENPNGEILDYQVIYYGYELKKKDSKITKRAVEVEIVDGPHVITVPASQNSIVINNLKENLNYTFTVRARTSAGPGENSTAVTVDLQASVGTGPLGVNSGSNTTLATTIVFVVLCAIFLIIIVVGVAAFIVWRRRKSKTGTLRILGSLGTTTAQVETTNFYEVPADVTTKTNPVAELEMDEPSYDVIPNHGASLDEDPPSDSKDNKTPKLAFRSEIPEDPPRYIDVSGAMKLDLAEEEEVKPVEADQELDHYDKISGEETKADLDEKDSEEDCDGDGELAYL